VNTKFHLNVHQPLSSGRQADPIKVFNCVKQR